MSLRFVRPFTVGAILLLLLIMTASPSVAATRQQPAAKPPSPIMTFGHFTSVHVTANAVLPTSTTVVHITFTLMMAPAPIP
ncbi:MAG: hypothetical protein ACYDER_25690 [Ktedonobacteraceae bacterium]